MDSPRRDHFSKLIIGEPGALHCEGGAVVFEPRVEHLPLGEFLRGLGPGFGHVQQFGVDRRDSLRNYPEDA